MKTVQLTQGYQALVDDQDFEWVSQWTWYAHVKKRKNHVAYAVRKDEQRKTVSMAVEIAKQAGVWVPGCEIDHVDTNRLNNQRYNLRSVTGSQNQANQVPRVNSSQYKGVSWDKARKLWQATLRHEGKKYNLGRYVDEDEAAEAYDLKARELFGKEFARTNFLWDENPDPEKI